MNIHSIYRLFSINFGKKRIGIFLEILKPTENTAILDVGGNIFDWSLVKGKPKITILNIKLPRNYGLEYKNNVKFVLGNGLNLPFRNNSFDIGYSNSAIEHLETLEKQKQFAKEIMRVGKNIFVQTPNKYFFIEPHLLTPFIHYLPKGVQRKLLGNFTIWGLIRRPSQQYCTNHVIDKIRLLSYKELRLVFPDCSVIKEKVLFFAKSFYIIQGIDKEDVYKKSRNENRICH